MTGKHCRIVEKYSVDWCWRSSRLFAVWVLLCKCDRVELSLQYHSKENTKQLNVRNDNHKTPSKGTGYASTGPMLGGFYSGIFSPMMDQYGQYESPVLDFRSIDVDTDSTFQKLFRFVTEFLPLRDDETPLEGLCEMIELSFFQNRAGQLLRNDSMADVSQRAVLHRSLLGFVLKVSSNKETSFLVTDARFVKKKCPGLKLLSIGDRGEDLKGKRVTGDGKSKRKDMRWLEVEKTKDSM